MTTLVVGFSNSKSHATLKLRENLLLVEGISPEEVLSALKQSTHGPEVKHPFSVFDLNRRVQYAARALKDRYPGEQVLFNATFLKDIDIPVSFVKHGEDWFVLDVSHFDAIHGKGKAMSVVSGLGSVALLPRDKEDAGKCAPLERKEHRFSLSKLDRKEFLGLLFALIKARRSNTPHTLRKLKSIIPEEAVRRLPAICRMYGLNEPLERDVLHEVSLQTGLEIAFESEDVIIRGLSHQEAGDINCLIEILHERTQAAWKWLFAVSGTCLHLFFKLLLVFCLATEDSIEHIEALALPWLVTLWAPFSLGAMWAYGRSAFEPA